MTPFLTATTTLSPAPTAARFLPLNQRGSVRHWGAVSIAMRDGPAAGLALIEEIKDDEGLSDYYWLYLLMM